MAGIYGSAPRDISAIAGSNFTKDKVLTLPNGDHQHPCGCITFWQAHAKLPPSLYYSKACGSHKGYVNRLGILATRLQEVTL